MIKLFWLSASGQTLLAKPSWSTLPVKPRGRTLLVETLPPSQTLLVKTSWSNHLVSSPDRSLLVKPSSHSLLFKSFEQTPWSAQSGQFFLVKPSRTRFVDKIKVCRSAGLKKSKSTPIGGINFSRKTRVRINGTYTLRRTGVCR